LGIAGWMTAEKCEEVGIGGFLRFSPRYAFLRTLKKKNQGCRTLLEAPAYRSWLKNTYHTQTKDPHETY